MKKIKIICTLGPSSFKKKILNSLKKEGVNLFRINLSHTNIRDIKKKVLYLKKNQWRGQKNTNYLMIPYHNHIN